MTTGEFADLVWKMREAQKNYFKTRLQRDLKLSKEIEKKVDDVLAARAAAKEPVQRELGL
ncbi:MAG: hypothetical protein II814_14095 [Treponema sp.]|nr:hypothetical protein [Treponema sp.]